MKILITADIHNGVPGKLKDTTWCMNIMRQYAKTREIKHVLVLGDLFHDRQNLGIDVINGVYAELKKAKEDDQEWVCFPGNHDMFLKNSWDINSLRPLENVLTVVSEIGFYEIDGQRFTILPFIHYEAKYMEALRHIQEGYRKQDILLTHIGIHGATLNECFLLKHWSIVEFGSTPYDRVFTGHFHCHQQVGNNVWYPGSPIPFRFDEGIVEHGFFEFDIDTRKHEFIKIFEVGKEFDEYKPADYMTIIDRDLPSALHLVAGNHVKLDLSRDYTPNELNKFRTILKSKGADQVRWKLFKKKIEEAAEVKTSINMSTPEQLFKSWLETDKPGNLDVELLMKLHQNVTKSAEEKIAVATDTDTDADSEHQ